MQWASKIGLTVLLAAMLAGCCLGQTTRTCFKCEGINCMRTTTRAAEQCLDSLDYCVTIFDKFTVVRQGCSLQIPGELRGRCEANTAECHKCNTDRCNDLGQRDYMCLQCDSSKDANCAKNPAALATSRCGAPSAPNSYCYVKYEDSLTKRGCATSVADQQSCFADANCLLCLPGDIRGCNSVDFKAGTRRMKF